MGINVRYFAIFRELTGRDAEDLAIERGDTASRVYDRLSRQYSFPLGLADVRVAINDDFAPTDQPLNPGDRLVFIPPVSGG